MCSIGIIGAGLAGLCTAYKLVKAGFRVRVYEATDRTGGRIWTKKFPNGQSYELGGEFIDSDHTDIISLVSELGLELVNLTSGTKPDLYKVIDYDLPDQPVVSYGIKSIIADYKKVFPQILADRHKAWPNQKFDPANKFAIQFDHVSLDSYIDTICADHNKFAQLVKQAYTVEYGIDCKLQPALNLIFLMGFGSVDTFSWFGLSDEIYKIKFGTEQLTLALTTILEQSGSCEIKLNCPICKIKSLGSVYELTGLNQMWECDLVVSTIPFPTYANINTTEADFSPAVTYLIQNSKLGFNSKLHVQFEKKFWTDRHSGYAISVGMSQIQNLFDCTTCSNQTGILVSYNGGSKCESIPDMSTFVTDLKHLYPEATEIINSDHWNWNQWKWSTGAYASFTLGQYTDLGLSLAMKEINTLTNTNFYFAGDAVAEIHSQGHMNGAVQTARIVVEQIVRHAKKI